MFNVLLVDDEELALTALRCSLPWEDYGFTEILSVTSAQEACELLKNRKIDAAFVDIRMPGMTGLKLLEELQPYNRNTVFIIVSGYSDFSYAKQAFEYGVMSYCLKPVVEEEYLPVLEKLSRKVLENRAAEDPDLLSRLRGDKSFCQEYLSGLTEKGEGPGEWTLLLVRTSSLFPFLQKADQAFCPEVFFLGQDSALLIFREDTVSERFFAFLDQLENRDEMLILCGRTPLEADAFLSTLKRLNALMRSKGKDAAGLERLSAVGKETAAYFSQILSYMEANYARRLTLGDLSGKFGMNYSYLSQLFKKTIGVTFAEHLTNIRMTQACRLLRESDTLIMDIADAVGYNDYHYFCNTFKNRYSVTPTEYRNHSGKDVR